jgi:RNA-directed DNA polymerase
MLEGLVLDPPYSDLDPSLMGTPRGGIISPFLANVALHGMENFLKEWILSQSWPMTSRHENYSVNKKKIHWVC